MEKKNLKHLDTGRPTYWLSDRNKLPNEIDFCIVKGISANSFFVEENLYLSLDHSIIMLTVNNKVIDETNLPSLVNKYTEWELFRLQSGRESNKKDAISMFGGNSNSSSKYDKEKANYRTFG